MQFSFTIINSSIAIALSSLILQQPSSISKTIVDYSIALTFQSPISDHQGVNHYSKPIINYNLINSGLRSPNTRPPTVTSCQSALKRSESFIPKQQHLHILHLAASLRERVPRKSIEQSLLLYQFP
jgi:hypothetical protein